MDRTFNYDDLGASFEIPEKISVGTNLRFHAGFRQAEEFGDYVVIKRWQLINSLGLLINWKCDYFQDPKADIEAIEDEDIANKVANLILRVVSVFYHYMLELRTVEKK